MEYVVSLPMERNTTNVSDDLFDHVITTTKCVFLLFVICSLHNTEVAHHILPCMLRKEFQQIIVHLWS